MLTDIHQALHVGTKPLYHLLRPFITYSNLLSLLQQISHLHYLLLSLTTGNPKACSLIPNIRLEDISQERTSKLTSLMCFKQEK